MGSGHGAPFLEIPSPFGEGVAVRFDPAGGAPAADAVAELVSGALHLRLPPQLVSAAPERRLSYLAGRYCAGAALLAAGATEFEVGVGADRSPQWPAGWVGSITHASFGFAASVVARADTCHGIGIDSERWIEAKEVEELRAEIATEAELRRVCDATGLSECRALTLVFSAKESLYKCLAPVAGRFFEFLDAELTAATSEGSLRLSLGVDLRDTNRPLSAFLRPGFEVSSRFWLTGEGAHTRISWDIFK